MEEEQTPFEAAREAMGLSVRRVAEHLGIDISGLSRIERGKSMPKRNTASSIYAFYDGAVPLGMVYDPTHPVFDTWLTKEKTRELEKAGKHLRTRHPQLAETDRRRTR